MKRVQLSSFFIFLISMAAVRVSAQCSAAFSFSVNGNAASFQAATTSPTVRHTWLMGDGQWEYPAASFTHTYNAPGTYTVTHISQDTVNHCTDSARMQVTLNFTPACNADFTIHADSSFSTIYTFHAPPPPAGVTWTLYSWKLNGQQVAATAEYSANLDPGTYNICLTTSNSLNCTATACRTVTVNPPNCNYQASFTYTASATNPRQLHFQANPSGAYSYSWSFGDGTSAFTSDPLHTFAQPGNYMVALRVERGSCRDTIRQQVHVGGSAADSCTLSLSINPVAGNAGARQLIASSNQTIVSRTWFITKIGDSLVHATLTAADPVYNFPDSGLYQVCVSITTSMGCHRTSCDTLVMVSLDGRSANTIPSYPNPATNSVGVQLNLDQATRFRVTVFDSHGVALMSEERNGNRGLNQVTLPIQALGRGQYFIDIEYNGRHKRSRFQKL